MSFFSKPKSMPFRARSSRFISTWATPGMKRSTNSVWNASLADEHRRQILNYLRITKRKLGLLVNFGSYPRVTIERYAL